MNNGQKIKYMELCLAVAREEVEYAELYKEKEPDYDEDFDAWCGIYAIASKSQQGIDYR